MLRAQAELKNFRTRVERDRAANREAVIAEVIRSLLPAIDDLDRAEAHGDLVEGSAAHDRRAKLRARLREVRPRAGRRGRRAVRPEAPRGDRAAAEPRTCTVNTVADVVETGYVLGDRLLRAAKVAVSRSRA